MVVENEEVLDPETPEDKGKDETPKEEVVPKKEPVPEDHPTKLGRRVQRMEEQFGTFSNKLDTLLEKFQEPQVDARATGKPFGTDYEDDPQILELERKLETRRLEREHQRQEEDSKYGKIYIKSVQGGFGDEEEELHDQIVDELLQSNFKSYMRHTNDPVRDAQINYGLALAAVLKRNNKSKVPNVKGDSKHAPTGVSSSSRMEGTPTKKVVADEYARKFIQSLGAKEDDEWVQKSLRGERE